MKYTGNFEDTAPKICRTANRRTTRPNLGNAAIAADAHDIQSDKRGTLFTEAGPVPVTINTSGTQRKAKDDKEAAKKEKKAANEAERSKAKGKGKGRELPVAVGKEGRGSPEMDETRCLGSFHGRIYSFLLSSL